MPAILDSAALVVVGINLPFAVYGYLLFGTNTQGKASVIHIHEEGTFNCDGQGMCSLIFLGTGLIPL